MSFCNDSGAVKLNVWRLIDFDTAIRLDSADHTLPPPEVAIGTLETLAPELLPSRRYGSQKASTKMDSWSYGMVLIQLLSGFSLWELFGQSERKTYDDNEIRNKLENLTQPEIDHFLLQIFSGEEGTFNAQVRNFLQDIMQIDPTNRHTLAATANKRSLFQGGVTFPIANIQASLDRIEQSQSRNRCRHILLYLRYFNYLHLMNLISEGRCF